jgi:3-deoxy-D-manno-octulosonate 8-phosphate phosphatase (KDO 8-P phosphatase)
MTYKERLNKITTFIFDIDGVLTNGDITIYQDEIVRTLNSRDGYAMQLAAKMGFNIFIISGGSSEPVKERLLHLGVKEVHLRAHDKLSVYQSLIERHGLTDEEIVYMGDDIPDYKVMQRVGCATCPQDAAIEIKSISHYQSPFGGGRFAVRDIVEQTLRVHEKWMTDEAFQW